MSQSTEDCAKVILEVAPLVMRAIRTEMRRHRGPELSVPQFRILTYLNRNEGASLSQAAEHIGLALPTMSKMIEGAVSRGLASRLAHPSDRRRVALSLTAEGRKTLDRARRATEAQMTSWLQRLSDGEKRTVLEAMRILGPVFSAPPGGA